MRHLHSSIFMVGLNYPLSHVKLTGTQQGIARNENDRKTLTKARVGALVRMGLRKLLTLLYV
jgi:hypothetical protein